MTHDENISVTQTEQELAEAKHITFTLPALLFPQLIIAIGDAERRARRKGRKDLANILLAIGLSIGDQADAANAEPDAKKQTDMQTGDDATRMQNRNTTP